MHSLRRFRHDRISALLTARNDDELAAVLRAAPTNAVGVGGGSSVLDVDGVPVFAKRIPITDRELAHPHPPYGVWSVVNVYGAQSGTNVLRDLRLETIDQAFVNAACSGSLSIRHPSRSGFRNPTITPLAPGAAIPARVSLYLNLQPVAGNPLFTQRARQILDVDGFLYVDLDGPSHGAGLALFAAEERLRHDRRSSRGVFATRHVSQARIESRHERIPSGNQTCELRIMRIERQR